MLNATEYKEQRTGYRYYGVTFTGSTTISHLLLLVHPKPLPWAKPDAKDERFPSLE